MELVEGPTLADRIAQGPIPLDEALPIAKQIAEALEAAHELGIIHRDLKPANIKVRDDGTVKILDFGLAKALDPAAGSRQPATGATNSPTLSLHATQAGLILGTAAYMAPEQAAGRPVDKRADIWAFGVVLWEMLAGRSLFGDGESVSHVLADVLRAPIDLEAVPAGPLRQLVRRCLDRNVKTRLRDIGEARIALAEPTPSEPAEIASPRPSASLTTWVLASALILVTGVAIWNWFRPAPPPIRSILRFTDATAVAQVPGALALSPDGTRLAFVGGPTRQIFVRSLDRLEAVPIPKTENASFLHFSRDGRWMSYVSGEALVGRSQLMKVALDGGPPQKLADLSAVVVGVEPPTSSWSDDGALLFNVKGALMRIPSSGGPAETLATPDAKNGERYFAAPQLLPDKQHVLLNVYVGRGAPNSNRVVALNLQSGEKKQLLERIGMTQYVPSEPGSSS